MKEIVICNTCQTKFEGYGWGTEQASGCSAELKNDIIVGFYGSAIVDGETWEILKNSNNIKDGNICDKCIDIYLTMRRIL